MKGRSCRGFTLTEVLISSIIMLLVISALAALSRQTTLQILGAKQKTSSLVMLEAKMERLMATPFSELFMGEQGFDGGRGMVYIQKVSDDLVSVKVAIGFEDGARKINLSTLRSRY